MFELHFSEKIYDIKKLPISGSTREYYRISGEKNTAIGTFSKNTEENDTFLYLSEKFLEKNLPVPRIYVVNKYRTAYLQEDLGNDTFYDFVSKNKDKSNFLQTREALYKTILNKLIELQIKGAKDLDFSKCYPREVFDLQSIMWDLNYFKYMFVKPAGIEFSEQALEIDFNNFARLILKAPANFFMYRDFQSRNIMYNNGEVKFIDYQGGRRGALQYDLASLLYEAKAQLPANFREKMLQYYAELVEQKTGIKKQTFIKDYHKFVLIRLLQALGAYGYRGIIEKKNIFIQSIAPAQENLKQFLQEIDFLDDMPELKNILIQISKSQSLRKLSNSAKLKLTISSFSYKRGIPYDQSGNGGGFVFDCRFLNNPGRIEKYKKLTGRDSQVIDYLRNNSDADEFANNCYTIIKTASESYISRNYTSLNIAFGCTGGQHRSVYLADKLAEKFKDNQNIIVELKHLEQNF